MTKKNLSAAEALYGFVAWLTSLDQPVTFSGHHEAGIGAELVSEFCKANGLPEPRTDWTKALKTPETRSFAKVVEGSKPTFHPEPHEVGTSKLLQKPANRIRVSTGPYDGQEGVFADKYTDASGKTIILVTLDLTGTNLEIPEENIVYI